jgi:hypothetical protein
MLAPGTEVRALAVPLLKLFPSLFYEVTPILDRDPNQGPFYKR